LTFGDSLKLSLTPTRKGEAMLVLFGKLGDEEKIAEAGELRIPLPSLRSLPEFRARVITDGFRVWVMLPSEEYREVPRDNKLCWLVDRLSSLFSEGRSGLRYTDDELIHRACLVWLGGRARSPRFLHRLVNLLLDGKREEARALLLAKEL